MARSSKRTILFRAWGGLMAILIPVVLVSATPAWSLRDQVLGAILAAAFLAYAILGDSGAEAVLGLIVRGKSGNHPPKSRDSRAMKPLDRP